MRKEERVRNKESATVGADVRCFSPNSSSPAADHLVVMVHGILGSTANWKFAAAQFVKTIPDKVIVHCSESNMHKLSLDGIDVMGERLAEEIIEIVNKRHEIKKISFVSHSVGGLVARYAIGRLYRPSDAEILDVGNCRGTMIGLEAMNFITIASPHLGSRGNKQVPFLFGVTAIERVAFHVIHWLFGRTGKHLFLSDNDKGEPPLLLRMINDESDLRFMSALNAFRRRVAYSNVRHDHIVGWRTSSIRRKSELPVWEEPQCERYPHIVYQELSKGCVDSEDPINVSVVDGKCDMLEEKIVTALTRFSWERVDVSFRNSRQRFDAHNAIQVKDTVKHSEGADVIQHMIDHFQS